jgi:hypothetical protein
MLPASLPLLIALNSTADALAQPAPEVATAQEAAPTLTPAQPTPAEDIWGDTDIGTAEMFALTPPPADARTARPLIGFVAGGQHQFDAGIDKAGDFNVTRALVGLGTMIPLSQRVSVGAAATYNFAGYDFDNSAAFGGGEPWGDINTARFMAVCNYAIDQHWAIVAGGVAGTSFDGGADVSDSWTGGGFIAGRYRASESLSIQLGVAVASHLEGDTEALPTFMVNWKIDEGWSFQAGALEFGVTDAVGAGVMYRLSDQLSLGGRAGYIREQFRLDDSGFAPDGVGQDERAKASLVLSWRPLPGMTIGVLGGIAFGGELKVKDQDGDRLFKEDYDTAPFVAARLVWSF